MYGKIVGIETVNYNNKQGKNSSLVKCHIVREPNKDGIVTVETITIFRDIPTNLRLGVILTPLFEKGFSGSAICTGFVYADEISKK